MRLKGRIALVTGGQRGIGRAICLRLAEEGADVAVNFYPGDPTAREQADELVQAIQAMGRRAIAVAADVSFASAVDAMVAEVARELGHVEILVNNAAIGPFARLHETTEEIWDRTLGINLKGPFLCARAVAPHMIERRWGKIVNIASTASKVSTVPPMPHYIASKAGLDGLTRALAFELGRHNINVNAVGPSTTATPLTAGWLDDPAVRESEETANPMRRIGTVEDVAACVAFLASDDARQVNGHLLMVDGGLTIRTPQPESY